MIGMIRLMDDINLNELLSNRPLSINQADYRVGIQVKLGEVREFA